jgi:hypothetical protein
LENPPELRRLGAIPEKSPELRRIGCWDMSGQALACPSFCAGSLDKWAELRRLAAKISSGLSSPGRISVNTNEQNKRTNEQIQIVTVTFIDKAL